jgi:hypothetical protein
MILRRFRNIALAPNTDRAKQPGKRKDWADLERAVARDEDMLP